MSKPRYDWWPYVKGIIRRYPDLCAQLRALKTPVQPCGGSPAGHAKGKHGDPTAAAALRELPPVHQRELDAVQRAVQTTGALACGAERLELIRLVFWSRTYTLEGAAQRLHISYRTARRWQHDFICQVAQHFGLL